MRIVMRDCGNVEEAMDRCQELMIQYPDENTKYMESWDIVAVDDTDEIVDYE
jgi:methylglyoxal synthase